MTEIFTTAGKRAGLQVWRVENFALATVQPTHHGSFYNGDCYLVLNSKKSGTGLLYDLHYWIGSDSSQDFWDPKTLFAQVLRQTFLW